MGVGFVDFYQLLISDFLVKEDDQPVHFVGVDAEAIVVARCAIIKAMMTMEEATNENILQVWYSTVMDAKTFKIFKDACRFALKDCQEFEECCSYLHSWMNEKSSPEEVMEIFPKNMVDSELYFINALKSEKDRMDYIDYIFSGKIFVGKDGGAIVGNPTFVACPADKMLGRNSIFYQFSPDCFKDYENGLLATLKNFLEKNVGKFRYLLKNSLVKITLIHEAVGGRYLNPIEQGMINLFPFMQVVKTHDDEEMAKGLALYKPDVIDWSNVPDYYEFSDFKRYMHMSGMSDTLHLAHAINWHYSTLGSCPLDYKNEGSYSELVESALLQINMIQQHEVKVKSYLSRFLTPNALRLGLFSSCDLVLTYYMKFAYLEQMKKWLKDGKSRKGLKIGKVSKERGWQRLVRSELTSFDYVMVDKRMDDDKAVQLMDEHLKF